MTQHQNVTTMELNYLDRFAIFWLVVGCVLGPVYLVACVLSVIKALADRREIKKRNAARVARNEAAALVAASQAELAGKKQNPLEIITAEVRENRWHRRNTSINTVHLMGILKGKDDNTKNKNAPANTSNNNLQDESASNNTPGMDSSKLFTDSENDGTDCKPDTDVSNNSTCVQNGEVNSNVDTSASRNDQNTISSRNTTEVEIVSEGTPVVERPE